MPTRDLHLMNAWRTISFKTTAWPLPTSSLPPTHEQTSSPFLGSTLFFSIASQHLLNCTIYLNCQSPPQDWKPHKGSPLCMVYSLPFAKHWEKHFTSLRHSIKICWMDAPVNKWMIHFKKKENNCYDLNVCVLPKFMLKS